MVTKEKKKKVLGRGLKALIGDAGVRTPTKEEKSKLSHEGEFFFCDVSRLHAGKTQPRKTFNEEALGELAASIKENGIIEPLVVRKIKDGFELIAGERRLRAARLAELKQVPIVVLNVSDKQTLELAIVENVQREDLNAIEEAEAYKSLMDFGLSQEGVAKKVGKQRATVANYLRLLKLPVEVKKEVANNNITMGHAKAILSLDTHAKQRELLIKILKKGLSVREAEKLSLEVSGAKEKTTTTKLSREHIKPVEEELRRIFGTKISVMDRAGKGKIEIDYYTNDERERILDMLRSVG
ncbi:MAG: ParB/RepB/Spo0J family partition protein [Deltaproteobacteria bacterium]|nr:ParB/RepB/Spo0J family partition protein [Deltaproteobacteria bacterium]